MQGGDQQSVHIDRRKSAGRPTCTSSVPRVWPALVLICLCTRGATAGNTADRHRPAQTCWGLPAGWAAAACTAGRRACKQHSWTAGQLAAAWPSTCRTKGTLVEATLNPVVCAEAGRCALTRDTSQASLRRLSAQVPGPSCTQALVAVRSSLSRQAASAGHTCRLSSQTSCSPGGLAGASMGSASAEAS